VANQEWSSRLEPLTLGSLHTAQCLMPNQI